MDKLKQELNAIFNKHKNNYKSKFKKVDSLLTQSENLKNFDIVFNKFIDDIIKKANEFSEIDKSKKESYLKKLIKKFNLVYKNQVK